MKPLLASLSLDLDDKWSYMKTHGDPGWETYPTILPQVVPRILEFLAQRNLRITFFIVGQDAALSRNRDLLQAIADAGHDIASHSFHHDALLAHLPPSHLEDELERSEQAIFEATGQQVRGFRGPSFSSSQALQSALAARHYHYDASSFPTFLGPVARAYFLIGSSLSGAQRARRKQLFGKWSDVLRPLRAHMVHMPAGELLEIPVTTMPLLRTPIHLTYLHFLAGRSRAAATMYFRLAVWLCWKLQVEPSLLLHALDFWGADDDRELAYFPGMSRTAEEKCGLVSDAIEMLQRRFQLVGMDEFAALRGTASPLPTDGIATPASGRRFPSRAGAL